ncbi:hypothetical protein [Bacteroides sp.]
MDPLKPKIALYVQRSFSDKLTAAFSFFNENWKLLVKYCAYFLLPVSILQSLFMNKFIGAAGNLSVLDLEGKASFMMSYGLLIFFSALGGLILCSLVYALMIIYNEREERLQGLTMAELKPVLFRCMGRLFIMGLFIAGVSILVIAVIGILASVSLWTLLLTIPFLIICLVPLALFFPIYLLEKIDIWAAFIKSFRLGFATWAGIFGISFVMGFIANVLQGVASIPWYIMFGIGVVLSDGNVQEAMNNSVGAGFLIYLFGVLMCFGAYISMALPILGIIYQYGHASEKMEHISVVDDIEKFEQL